MRFVEQRFGKVGLFVAALLSILAAGLFFSPSAHAQGEYYQYIPGNDTIRVTGGVLTQPAGLQRTGTNSFQGGITVRGDISRIPDGNAATLTRPCQYTLEVDEIQGDLRQPGDQPGGAHNAQADITDLKWALNPVGDDNGDQGCKPGDLAINAGSDTIKNHITTAIRIHNVPDPRGDAGGQACPGSNAPAGTDCSTIPPGCPGSPQQGTPPATCPFQAVAPTEEAVEPDPCPISKDTELRWIVCPVVELAALTTGALDKFIDAYMVTGNDVFLARDSDYKTASDVFRNFAIGVILIAGILMIIAEALGLPFVDAYTMRKLLPRMVFAVIAVSLWWPMAYFIVGFFDLLGQSMGGIIYSSFNIQPGSVDIGGLFAANAMILGGAIAGGFALGPAGLVSLIGSLLLAMAIGAAVLIGRHIVLAACIIVGSLGMALRILDQTKSVGDWVWSTFIRANALFPIATGLIALCKVLGNITINSDKFGASLIGLLIFFMGYVLLPAAVRFTGGFMATIGGFADSKSKGLFDRSKNFRHGKVSERFNSAREGRGGYMGANAAGALYRRATLPGGLSVSRRGRADFAAQSKMVTRNAADEALKHDNNFASGNDFVNQLAAQKGMTRGRLEDEVAAKLESEGMSRTDARRSARLQRAELEAGYGAQIGTDTMRLTAFKALAASNKGYDHENALDNYREAADYGADLINDGIINESDAAAIWKSNGGRSDASGVGFGSAMGMFAKAAERKRMAARSGGRAARADLVTAKEASALSGEVLDGSNPGAIIQGRHEAVTALAPEMVNQVISAQSQSESDNDPRVLSQQLGALAGLYDEMGRTSPQKARIMADRVLSRKVKDNTYGREVREAIMELDIDPKTKTVRKDENGNDKYRAKKDAAGNVQYRTKIVGKGDMVTIRELMERARDKSADPVSGRNDFRDTRREYGSRLAHDQATQADHDLAG